MQFIGTHHQARRDWATKVIIVREVKDLQIYGVAERH
jgi:hypothetical protein